ncbi:MAG: SixA phosphatase family protein [Acidobacteriota bacterium]
MRLALVHHADAVGPDVDPQRPLSSQGIAHAERIASQAKAVGFSPAAIWHSGKLRARQTAEAFLRACNPFAEFRMVRGLHPDDPPEIMRDALREEERDLLVTGHMPHIAALLQLLAPDAAQFPAHGLVMLERRTDGEWKELSRI